MRSRIIALSFTGLLIGILISSCRSESEIYYARYFVSGKGVYEKHCQNCHAADGSGLRMLIPPLTDTTYLKENKSRLSCIIKNGMTGPVTINGKIYDGSMPGEHHLSNIEIAAVITFITNSFGNKQGLYDVNDVEEDLKTCN